LSLPIYNQEARGFNNIFNRIAKGFHILAKRFELNFFTRKTVLYRIKPGRKKSSSQPVILPIAQPFKKPLESTARVKYHVQQHSTTTLTKFVPRPLDMESNTWVNH